MNSVPIVFSDPKINCNNRPVGSSTSNNQKGAELRTGGLYNSNITKKIYPYLTTKDFNSFEISDRQQQKRSFDYWQTRIEQSGLTDIEATKTTKINFIRQFENTSEAKKNILFMNKIGFSKQQTLNINCREIDQIKDDYTFTKAILDCHSKIKEGNQITREQLIEKLTSKNLWSDDKEGKLNNLIKAFNKIKAAQIRKNGGLLILERLYLRSGNLAALIPEIQKIPNLSKLNISRNQLKELPANIGGLTTLTWLVAYNNQLKELPESIGNLTALIILNVRWNQLKALPASIGNLTALSRLGVSGNSDYNEEIFLRRRLDA